jgi:hypothetical protein
MSVPSSAILTVAAIVAGVSVGTVAVTTIHTQLSHRFLKLEAAAFMRAEESAFKEVPIKVLLFFMKFNRYIIFIYCYRRTYVV